MMAKDKKGLSTRRYWNRSDRAVLVFDTPPPPCKRKLLPYLLSAMPQLTTVDLNYICTDVALAALGRYLPE
jgi:hypothetical protein